MPQVSVVLPTHDRARYLPRAIDSVLAQSFSDFELIVVDDCSTDDSRELVSRCEDRRVRLVCHQRNRGAAAARNTGIQEAVGAYIAFQDSDDVWLSHKLEQQMDLMLSRPDCEMVFGSFLRVEGGTVRMFGLLDDDQLSSLAELLLKENYISPQTTLAKATFLKRHGLFDGRFPRYMDWDQALRVCRVTTLGYDPEPLVVVFNTHGSISSNVWNDSVARQLIAIKHREKFEGHAGDLAINYAEAGYSAVASGRLGAGISCFGAALRNGPFKPSVWLRLCKAAYRTAEPIVRRASNFR